MILWADDERSEIVVTDYELFMAMEKFGGSFAKAIAAAAFRADEPNRQKLKAAFPELIDEYRDMAESIGRRKAAR